MAKFSSKTRSSSRGGKRNDNNNSGGKTRPSSKTSSPSDEPPEPPPPPPPVDSVLSRHFAAEATEGGTATTGDLRSVVSDITGISSDSSPTTAGAGGAVLTARSLLSGEQLAAAASSAGGLLTMATTTEEDDEDDDEYSDSTDLYENYGEDGTGEDGVVTSRSKSAAEAVVVSAAVDRKAAYDGDDAVDRNGDDAVDRNGDDNGDPATTTTTTTRLPRSHRDNDPNNYNHRLPNDDDGGGGGIRSSYGYGKAADDDNNNKNSNVPIIDFSKDPPRETTWGRRLATRLMRQRWYYKAGENSSENNIGGAAEATEVDGDNSPKSDDAATNAAADRSFWDGSIRALQRENPLLLEAYPYTHARRETPSLAKAWACTCCVFGLHVVC